MERPLEPVSAEEYRGFKIYTFFDGEPEDPREWDNLGTMACIHEDYYLGDQHGFQNLNDLTAAFDKPFDGITLPLFLSRIHNLSIHVGSPPAGQGNSTLVGYIYVSRKDVLAEYNWRRLTHSRAQRVEEYLSNEIEVYNQYLANEVYGFQIEGPDGSLIDSCRGGYFGDPESHMIPECKTIIDSVIAAREVKAEPHYLCLRVVLP